MDNSSIMIPCHPRSLSGMTSLKRSIKKMSDKHIVHHKGSPREDADYGPLVLAVIVIGGAIAIVNAIVAMLPFLLGAGVISLGTYLFVNSQFAKLKFKQFQLRRIEKKIEKSRLAEEVSREVTASFSKEERAVAKRTAKEATQKHIDEFNDKRAEIVAILEAGLARLSESRDQAFKNAKDAKSPEKFEEGIEKLDDAIEQLQATLNEIENDDP